MTPRSRRLGSAAAFALGFLFMGCTSESSTKGRDAAPPQSTAKPNPGEASPVGVKGGKAVSAHVAPRTVPFQSEGVKEGFTLEMGAGITMEFVGIGCGRFTMGNGDNGVRPHEEVIDKPFYLGKYEVTQEQWKLVMGTNPSFFPEPKNPVERLQWADCQAFLQKMNEKYAGTGRKFFLPTEIQWEYACRGGYNTSYGTGIDLESAAWYSANAKNRTHPVGEKRPSGWGLHDILGNVWEWCSDQQVGGLNGGPAASSADRPYAVRGGGYHDDGKTCGIHARVTRPAVVPFRLDGLRLCCVDP